MPITAIRSLSSGSAGYVQFADSKSLFDASSVFYVDKSNGLVGIGNLTPSSKLDIVGSSSDTAGTNQILRFNNNFGFRVDASTGQYLSIDTYNSGWNTSPAMTVRRVGPTIQFGATDITYAGTFGYITNNTVITGGEATPDFKYIPGNNKLYCRSIMLAEWADTVDVAIRRWNGSSYDSPSGMSADQYVGNVYWQPFGTDNTFDPGVGSPSYGRIASISAMTSGTPTGSSRGGRLIFGTTKEGELIVRERAWISAPGNFVIGGRGSYEDGGAVNPQQWDGYGVLSVCSPKTITSDSAISIREYTDRDRGFDISVDESSHTTKLQVSNGGKVDIMSITQTLMTMSVPIVSQYKSSDSSSGISTTITTASLSGKTITVKDGIITGFA